MDRQTYNLVRVDCPTLLRGMTPRGLSISNDGSGIVCGSVISGTMDSERVICAAAKFFPPGILDTKFGAGGLMSLDASTATADNYLIEFSVLGKDENDNNKRKFLGIGAKVLSPLNTDFMVVRFD